MDTNQFIYSEEFVRGRIYSYLIFQKYMTKIAEMVCKELGMDEKIILVSLNSSGDTVWVMFEESEFGFDACFLWDKNLKGNIEKLYKSMIPIPSDVIEKLNDGYFLIVKHDENITAWRIKDNLLQNRCKHKSGTTNWMTIKYLILPMEAEYSFRKLDKTE